MTHLRIVEKYSPDMLAGDAFYMSNDRDEVAGITIKCPKCGALCGATFVGQYAWTWDHNEQAPTINPSLLHSCGFHCFVRGGEMQEV